MFVMCLFEITLVPYCLWEKDNKHPINIFRTKSFAKKGE